MKHLNFSTLLKQVLDWSEVWAILIPLFILRITHKKQPFYLKPVITYLWLALVMNLLVDVVGDFKAYLPSWAQSNNPIYNIHSLVRFGCFSYFFILLRKSLATRFKKIILWTFVVFIIVNFFFFETFFNPRHLSGDLLAVEAYLLLICCMQYYLSQLRQNEEGISEDADFWVVTGLSIFVVINFFLFLFYVPMITENPALADKMWDIHNVAYIIFCILIAKAFYVPARN
ncbi:hypothetical protein [Segetibacter aerophilus]|nr:hypothetical protein [Segetibacter aerophilus]